MNITSNTFTTNTYPIYLYHFNEGAVITNNSGSSNTYDVIGLSYVGGDITLQTENNLIYYVSHLSVSGNLTV